MTPPTDLELMMYHDGELDPARADEVRAFLDEDDTARTKLAGLDVVGRVVRERALATHAAAGDLTDLVMARVRAEASPRVAEREGQRASSKSAAPAAVSKVRELRSSEGLPGASGADGAAANDNGRLIFGLAAAAAAAAAALFIWGRSANPGDGVANRPPPPLSDTALVAQQTGPVEMVQPSARELPTPAPSLAFAADEEAPHSVDVDAVDFGTNAGTVIYVTNNDKATATTVVWVRDE